jgi:hypothetical protein
MRRVTFATIVGLIVFGAWSAGRAQARLANFEITVEAARGPVRVTCNRGCDWPANEGSLVCDSDRCRWSFTEHGRVLLGQPR